MKQFLSSPSKKKKRRHSGASLFRLIKASLLILIAPLMVLTIYAIYGKLSAPDAMMGIAASFFISILFIRPYLADLSSLTEYVEQLALDKRVQAPALSFLSNVEELSSAVNHLHTSWETKKLHLEAAVIESKIIFDTLPDIIIMTDSEFHIVRANSAAHITFGRSLNERKLEEIVHDPLLFSFMKWVMHDKRGKDLELTLPELQGRHYVVRIEKFPVHSPGGIALIIVMHDITEAKRTEKMFMDFVANASHEIRTPLTSIVGFIETLRTVAKDDKEAQQHFLGVMAQQADRMARLVSDLLSLSKIEMNANTLPTEKVDIRSLLENAVRQMEWNAKERNIVIETNVAKRLPKVTGDYNELLQVFSNLLGNAIKYGSGDSTITVTAKISTVIPKDAINYRALQKALAISVEDRGEGIPPEHIPRLTERFYRVDTGRSRKIGGTGLGLAIVKHILKRHQGALNIESTLGKGSVFTVYLPIE